MREGHRGHDRHTVGGRGTAVARRRVAVGAIADVVAALTRRADR